MNERDTTGTLLYISWGVTVEEVQDNNPSLGSETGATAPTAATAQYLEDQDPLLGRYESTVSTPTAASDSLPSLFDAPQEDNCLEREFAGVEVGSC